MLGRGELSLAGGKMRGRVDASFLLEEVWWLGVMEMRGTSLWKDRFDREMDPLFAGQEGRRTGHLFFVYSYGLESSGGGKTSLSAMRHYNNSCLGLIYVEQNKKKIHTQKEEKVLFCSSR